MKYLINFILLTTIICCNSKSNETKAFQEYLKTTFNISIAKELTNYLVIPKNLGCSGCKQLAIVKMEALTKIDNKLIIIGSININDIKVKHTFLIDSLSEIENYNLNTQNVCIIQTENFNVQKIITTNSLNIDSIFSNYKF